VKAPEISVARVRALIDERCWNLADLVTASGVNRVTLAQLLAGRRVSRTTIRRVAEAFGVPPSELLISLSSPASAAQAAGPDCAR
jgi:transcriptional regulator with XRE-family HTH domain